MASPLNPSLRIRWGALLAAIVVAQPACVSRELARAPASPDEAWTVPEDGDYARALRGAAREDVAAGAQRHAAAGVAESQAPAAPPEEPKSDAARQNRVPVDPARKYTLPELIDIAERHHPETRDAWEKARQAALAVGLAEATYLPDLAAKVVAGYQRTPLPLPMNIAPAGFVTFTTAEVVPLVAAKWLLFDFGQREAGVQEAEAKSFVANVTFTEAHEKVLYEVSRAYFALDAARASVRVAEDAAENAQRTQDISEARRTQGVATVVDVAQARRQSAQAHFDVVRARGAERTAYSALVASMGVDPDGTFDVADSGDRALPPAPLQGLRALVERALVSRPDVLAALGKVRAAEAGLRRARAAYGPSIGLSGQFYGNIGWWSVGGPFFSLTQPGLNALLTLDWPIFDGGAREVKVAIAHSELSGARAALDGARDRAAQDVTSAYDQLQTSFAEYQAATDVEQTARTAFDAAVDAYRSGVGLLTDVLAAENAEREAQLQKENARASVFTSAAALAFALGSATRP
jgi:outer membrane protein TolC